MIPASPPAQTQQASGPPLAAVIPARSATRPEPFWSGVPQGQNLEPLCEDANRKWHMIAKSFPLT